MAWIRDRFVATFNSWVERLIFVGFVALALLIWRVFRENVREDLTLPTWLVAAVLGAIIAILAIQGLRLRQRRGHVEVITGFALEASESRAMVIAYADHLTEMLYALQRVLAGVIPGVNARDFIEDGILQPARDLITSRQEDDVRLSILAPDGQNFVMPFAAGHHLESKKNFSIPIDTSFSRWAFNDGLIYWSSDLPNDDRFIRHPRAAQERDYASIISVPIRAGENTVAVFNAIFTPVNAFDEADFVYVTMTGAIIELAWQLAGL